MKKTITATRRREKTIRKGSKLTVGMDIGDRSSSFCVLNDSGDVVLERRVATTKQKMREVFGAFPRSRVALETGAHSPWVSRLLTECGHEVIVAHARNVRLIGESTRKDDRLGARTLARLARIDPQLLSPIRHRSAEAQAHLTVIRSRAVLVHARTAIISSARGLAKSFGERLRPCGSFQVSVGIAADLSPDLRAALAPLLVEVASRFEAPGAKRRLLQGPESLAQTLQS